jgi:arginyl-tRNA synthetase
MRIALSIESAVIKALKKLYELDLPAGSIMINQTKPEFEGDYTVVLFGLIKQLKKNPELLGSELGNFLVTHHTDLFEKFNVLKGFLNLTLKDSYLLIFLQEQGEGTRYGYQPATGKRIMI